MTEARILVNPKPRKKTGLLENDTHCRMRRDDRLAIDGNRAAACLIEASDKPEQRRFSAT